MQMTVPGMTRPPIVLALLLGVSLVARGAWAQAVPEAVELPAQLSLDQAVQVLRTHGLDVLIAEAAVHVAEGDVGIAGAVPNPALSLTYGRVLPPYDPNSGACAPGPGQPGAASGGCSADQYSAGLSDQAAIEDSLSGKRGLRLRVARAALAAAKMSRA